MYFLSRETAISSQRRTFSNESTASSSEGICNRYQLWSAIRHFYRLVRQVQVVPAALYLKSLQLEVKAIKIKKGHMAGRQVGFVWRGVCIATRPARPTSTPGSWDTS